MRLARICLLLAAARAFTPVPPVAARTTPLYAQEEANVGTAVRNIAPWLLFVLVGPAPRSNHFSRQPRRHRAVTQPTGRFHNRAGAAHPELQGVRRREGPRGLREPATLLPVALRARHRRCGLTHGYVILGPAVHLRPWDFLLQPVFACVKINPLPRGQRFHAIAQMQLREHVASIGEAPEI